MREQRKLFQALALVTQFGLNMIIPIAMCMALGVWLDKKYDMPWVIIVLFFIGALAGFTNVFKMAKPLMESEKKRNEMTARSSFRKY